MGNQPSVLYGEKPFSDVRFTTGRSVQFAMQWARSSISMAFAVRGWRSREQSYGNLRDTLMGI